MKKPPAGRLLYAASETDADILYPTGFFAPDPFLFVQKGTHAHPGDERPGDGPRPPPGERRPRDVVVEDRGAAGEGRPQGARRRTSIALALRQLGLRRVEVPQSFPLGLAMELDARGIRLDLGPEPFWPEREIKAPHEVRAIEASLRAAEAGLLTGIEALRACRVRKAAGSGATAGSSRPRTCAPSSTRA